MIDSFIYRETEILYNKDRTIDSFTGPYAFLSNFYLLDPPHNPINRGMHSFRSSEHAYMWHKPYDDHVLRDKIENAATAAEAKKLGKLAKLHPDWDNEMKFNVMVNAVREKFRQNKILRASLLKTGYAYLIEGNTWGDVTWGCCRSQHLVDVFGEPGWGGENHLGKILMLVREEARTGLL